MLKELLCDIYMKICYINDVLVENFVGLIFGYSVMGV